MEPPTPSMSEDTWSALRRPAPLVSTLATMDERPSLPMGSYASPAGSMSANDTTGCRLLSMSSTRSPFGSDASWNGGMAAGFTGPGAGALVGAWPRAAAEQSRSATATRAAREVPGIRIMGGAPRVA